jgi:Transposase, Mutator family
MQPRIGRDHRSPARPSLTVIDEDLRADRDRGTARAACWHGRKTTEWKSKVLRTYQRRTLAADALIASAYLAGTNTRSVRRALNALFAEGIGKDVVSRVWRKVKSDWGDRGFLQTVSDGAVA